MSYRSMKILSAAIMLAFASSTSVKSQEVRQQVWQPITPVAAECFAGPRRIGNTPFCCTEQELKCEYACLDDRKLINTPGMLTCTLNCVYAHCTQLNK
jgi:hypothetical protein